MTDKINTWILLPSSKFNFISFLGLDPARPLINRYGSKYFRLTRDDAEIVQIIHTNAGFLGDIDRAGHVDFCVNGGMIQPGCKGNRVRKYVIGYFSHFTNIVIGKFSHYKYFNYAGQARCSHFQSACYFAATVRNGQLLMGRPCTPKCPKPKNTGILPGQAIPMGEDTPDEYVY